MYAKHLIDALRTFEPAHTYTLCGPGEKPEKHIDLIHYPYFDPFLRTLPLRTPKPTVVTVHDLIPLLFPKEFPKGIRGTVKWMIQKKALKAKQRIITDAKCSRDDISRIIGFRKDQIDVIPLAPSLDVEKQAHGSGAGLPKIHIPDNPYLLYVGDVNWNKNIPGLLEAFASVTRTASHAPTLVLVGKAFTDQTLKETQDIQKRIHSLGIEPHILMPGYVSDNDLISLYRHAMCLILPSYYEGFGFPVVDAFMLGCPVICSDTGSLKEIAGPALRVDPYSSQSIAEAIIRIAGMDQKKRKTMIADGHVWVRQFSWKTVAHQTIASYEKVLG